VGVGGEGRSSAASFRLYILISAGPIGGGALLSWVRGRGDGLTGEGDSGWKRSVIIERPKPIKVR
jgi:hypothetical protein